VSLKLQRQIDQLRKDREKDRKKINEISNTVYWLSSQLRSGLSDVATIAVTKILEQGLEAEIVKEKSTDEQLTELLNNG